MTPNSSSMRRIKMTNETIEQVIDSLNAGEMCDRTFRRALTDHVEYAKVWLFEPKGECGNEGSYEFFFIRNEENAIVAAVLDMPEDHDLHCFVKHDHRGRGYLESAMISVIWPYFYQQGRTKQRVSIQDPRVMRWAIKRLGFIEVGHDKAEIDLMSFANVPPLGGNDFKFDDHEFSITATHLRKAKSYLTMVKEKISVSHSERWSQLEAKLDERIEASLDELVRTIELIKEELHFLTEQ